MTNIQPREAAANQGEYAEALEESSQRTGVDLGFNTTARVEQAEVIERRELEAKFPNTTRSLNELTSEQSVPPIAAFVGFLIFVVALTLWCWPRLSNSKDKNTRPRNTLSHAFSAKDTRATVVIAMLWIICILLWGYIWRWDSKFTGNQFIALVLAGPVIIFLGLAGIRWIRASKK